MDRTGVATGAQTAAEQKLVAAHQHLLNTPGLQFKFTTVVQPEAPDWLKSLVRLLGHLVPGLKYLFWAGLVVLVAGLLFLIGREIWRVRFARLPARGKPLQAQEWRPDAVQARALLEDADQLAAQGRFNEAVHLILYRSIDDLSGRKPGVVRPALTSRDIAAMQAMPARARDAFGHIAAVVERSFFGGRPIGQAEFTDCRGAYERFALAEGWS